MMSQFLSEFVLMQDYLLAGIIVAGYDDKRGGQAQSGALCESLSNMRVCLAASYGSCWCVCDKHTQSNKLRYVQKFSLVLAS